MMPCSTHSELITILKFGLWDALLTCTVPLRCLRTASLSKSYSYFAPLEVKNELRQAQSKADGGAFMNLNPSALIGFKEVKEKA